VDRTPATPRFRITSGGRLPHTRTYVADSRKVVL
jgi:hypothetical protein